MEREVAARTSEIAGGGTTAATVLAQSIVIVEAPAREARADEGAGM